MSHKMTNLSMHCTLHSFQQEIVKVEEENMDRPLQDLPQIQIPLTRPQDTGELKQHIIADITIWSMVDGLSLGPGFSDDPSHEATSLWSTEKTPNSSESNQ